MLGWQYLAWAISSTSIKHDKLLWFGEIFYRRRLFKQGYTRFFSKNSQREWYMDAAYQILFESGQWKFMKWPTPCSVIQAQIAKSQADFKKSQKLWKIHIF